MGLSFLKRIRLFPGLGINLGSGGVSISAGPRGLKVSRKLLGRNASHTQITAAKYGVRYTQTLDCKKPANPWPFKDPKTCAVFVLEQIITSKKPILFVLHDTDGYWQFLDGENVSLSKGRMVSLKSITSLDASILQLSGLKTGWCALRKDASNPWEFKRIL